MNISIKKTIYVTQPSLPPLNEFVESLKTIWDNKILTNNGPFHKQFEKYLDDYLRVKYVSLFANGTLALITSLQALRITGEVITTPFSFVATTHSLKWNGITPIFCDIEEDTLNLNPDKIESLITPKTTAILPVHVYGHPCKIKEIQEIADIYGLKVIYDAAHAFGVKWQKESICNYGDISILSFHATKLFNTFEGGAIVCKDAQLKKRIDFLKNFGFADETTVIGVGINAKMNEVQAAFGLLQLEIVSQEISNRKKIAEFYRSNLANIDGIKFFDDFPDTEYNYAYFPILIDPALFGTSRDQLYEALKKENIFTRRYFYPLISHFPSYRNLPSAASDNLPVAEKVSKRVLCLPIYGNLGYQTVDIICQLIIEFRK